MRKLWSFMGAEKGNKASQVTKVRQTFLEIWKVGFI